MKFQIGFERVYPHSVEKVWQSLIEPAALGQWLMETDFKPEKGRAFTMWCDDGEGGTDVYHCRLLEYEPPRRMLWSWVVDGAAAQGETLVEFRVAPADGGTRLTIVHSGDRTKEIVEKFKGGWPAKLAALASVLPGD